MLRRWVVAACARECGNALIRSDFEVLQRAVLPAFAPLLRKHPGDPKCETTELCFLLRAGWVVVRPLRGRGCSWCAPAGGARAKCGLECVLHRDFWEHPSHLCPYSGGYLFFFLAPFDARPGPWLYLARVKLMGAHQHQQHATAGHTSTKTPAEIRKAMSVRLAIIAAEGHGGCFFLPPPLRGGLDGP